MWRLALGVALAAAPAAAGGFADDNADFAFALYARLPARGNLFYSPYSISSAFGMVYAGAAGETAAELAGALRFRGDPDELHRGFQETNADLNAWGSRGAIKLSVANALWGELSQPFRKDFVALCARRYGGGLRSVSFLGAAEGARREINAWAEERTAGRIKDLVPPPLPGDTKLILTNAVYFKGDWVAKFNKAATRPEPFHKAGGGTSKAPLMRQTGSFRYAEFDGFQALELPYNGERLAMLVLLPRTQDGLPALEKKLSARALEGWGGALAERRVEVYLPKFTLDQGFSLNQALAALGARLAFDPDRADFSPMTGKRGFYISQAVHKAFVAVDEEGTEAAAATAVMMAPGAAALPAPPAVFRADRPFLFLIRDIRGNVLFLGRLADPR